MQSTEEQIKNESRLTSLEITQREVLKTLQEVKKSNEDLQKELNGIKITFAKGGGVVIALTSVGAVIGWVLSNIKHFLGITG